MSQLLRKIAGVLFCCFIILPANAGEALLQTTANPEIKQGYVDTSLGQIHYWTAGEGPNLLLIHQSSSSAEEYAGLVPYMADQYRMISFDWPGHGNSDNPATELGVDDFTNAALAVLDHLGAEKFHLLGNHGGALIAMNLAANYPQRVDHLILAGTSGLKNEAEAKEFVDKLDLVKRKYVDRDGKSLSDAWQRFLAYMPDSTPEEILIPYLTNMSARLRPYDAHFGVLRWDRKPALDALRNKPLLLLQAERDDFVSKQETLLTILEGAERKVLKNAGVFMFFENPEASASLLLDYLGGTK